MDRYNSRVIEGTNKQSMHTGGRALDFFSGDLQAKANWAINQPGVSVVIYNRMIWTPSKGWHKYTGVNPHTDHVHVN